MHQRSALSFSLIFCPCISVPSLMYAIMLEDVVRTILMHQRSALSYSLTFCPCISVLALMYAIMYEDYFNAPEISTVLFSYILSLHFCPCTHVCHNV
jgi:hypothetical protein